MVRVREDESTGVAPVVVAALSEDRLRPRVVQSGDELEVRRADALHALAAPAGERARLLAYVRLGVAAGAVGTEREELHQLAPVVLVGRQARVLVAVGP